MPKINHVAAIDVLQNPPTSGVVISIRDPGNTYTSLYNDIDKLVGPKIIPIYAFDVNDEIPGCLTDADAFKIANILLEESAAGNDVIVHCTAGICRSGAVAEVGMMVGLFDKVRTHRQPNTLFKRKIAAAIFNINPNQATIAFNKRFEETRK